MNRIEVMGNLGADAEVKEFSGEKYVSFRIADKYGDKEGETKWWNVLKKGDGGKLLPYLKKGTPVLVRGAEASNIYKDKDGEARLSHNVKAFELHLCPGQRKESAGGGEAKKNNTNEDLPF